MRGAPAESKYVEPGPSGAPNSGCAGTPSSCAYWKAPRKSTRRPSSDTAIVARLPRSVYVGSADGTYGSKKDHDSSRVTSVSWNVTAGPPSCAQPGATIAVHNTAVRPTIDGI